jgi:predicted metalloendopeptidase
MTLPSGIRIDELDPGIRPQDDLFRHVNGRWLARTEIPADRARDSAFRILAEGHSPGEFRCNQIVRNLDEFYAAFDVGATDELWLEPAARVRIW